MRRIPAHTPIRPVITSGVARAIPRKMSGRLTAEGLVHTFKTWIENAAKIRRLQAQGDPRHYENLRGEIRKAFDLAPAGKPVVCLGFGEGNDYPLEMFGTKYRDKFPRMVLVDASRVLIDLGLQKLPADCDVATQLANGRLQVLEANLSGINPHFLLPHLERALATSSTESAQASLVASLREKNTSLASPLVANHAIEEMARGEKPGLVISSTLFPDCYAGILPWLEIVVRNHFEKDFDDTQLRHFDFAFNRSLSESVDVLVQEVCHFHQRQLRGLIDPEGLVLFSAHVAFLKTNTMRKNLQLEPERLAFHYRNLALGPENISTAVYQDSLHFHRALLQFQGPARGGFGPTVHLGMDLRQSPMGWTRGFKVEDANAWIYSNNPEVCQATLVQSLLMSPRA